MTSASLRFIDGNGTQTTNFIDLNKRDYFVCETKQGVEQPGRFAAVRATLAGLPGGGDTEAVAAVFKGARRNRVAEILDTLVGLGQIQQTADGRYRL